MKRTVQQQDARKKYGTGRYTVPYSAVQHRTSTVLRPMPQYHTQNTAEQNKHKHRTKTLMKQTVS
jgi:hypothetical protein